MKAARESLSRHHTFGPAGLCLNEDPATSCTSSTALASFTRSARRILLVIRIQRRGTSLGRPLDDTRTVSEPCAEQNYQMDM